MQREAKPSALSICLWKWKGIEASQGAVSWNSLTGVSRGKMPRETSGLVAFLGQDAVEQIFAFSQYIYI